MPKDSLDFAFDEAPYKEHREQVVQFLFAKLPCVPIKVIRANTLDTDAQVIRLVDPNTNTLLAAVVFKDHPDREFREVSVAFEWEK